MDLDFGSVPDWVEALGTSGALIFIAIQHRLDRQRDRNQRQDEADAKRRLEARQARLISVSVGLGFNSRDGFTYGVGVQNDSAGPIRNLNVVIIDRSSAMAKIDLEWRTADRKMPFLAAGARRDFSVRPVLQPVSPRDGNDRTGYRMLEQSLNVGVEFTDAEGLRWRQFENGVPVPVAAPK